MQQADDFIWLLEDTPDFIGGRVVAAIDRYRAQVPPPMFGAVATGIVPYPPGIPLLMPGEAMGSADDPILGYLKSLEAIDRLFPGFGHDTHGVENHGGTYQLQCLRAASRAGVR